MLATPLFYAASLLFATALATPQSSNPGGPCLSADFSLAMRLGVGSANTAVYVSLNAVDSGSNGTLLVVGERLSRYPGTPVALSGKSGNATLDFKINEQNSACHTLPQGTFGISVPDVGERYGAVVPVLATKNQPWPHFYYADGQINPERTSAAQLWFACDTYIQGQKYLQLEWGLYNENGTTPMGCSPTEVIQVFNIPCADA